MPINESFFYTHTQASSSKVPDFISYCIVLSTTLSIIFTLNSCKKFYSVEDNISTVIKQEDFFKVPATTDSKVKAVADYLSTQNNRLNFVEKTITQVGFPVWDKIMYRQGRVGIASRGGGEKAPDVYYIPFVRENENYVNALMVVHAGQEDTVFSWRCDWQYQNLSRGQTAATDTAGMYASLFLNMNNFVFGHTQFELTDTSLFSYNGKASYYAKVSPADSGNSFLQVVTYCTTITTGQFTECPAPNSNQCRNGCDLCRFCVPNTSTTTSCWETLEDDGGAFPSTGGEGTSGSGGSGTTPTCSGGGSLRFVTDPCGSGWIPMDEEEEENPHAAEPCEVLAQIGRVIDSLYAVGKYDSAYSSFTNFSNNTGEYGFVLYQSYTINFQNSLDTIWGTYGQSQHYYSPTTLISFTPNLPYHSLSVSFAHTHDSTSYSSQSAFDIYRLIEKYVDNSRYKSNFVKATNGEEFAISITNPQAALTFLNTRNNFLNGDKWKENTSIDTLRMKVYNDYLRKSATDENKYNIAYKNALAAVLEAFNAGITLYEKNSMGEFVPVVLVARPDPKKRNKLRYTNPCL